ncbi:acid-sensing ion channel 5-like [Mytilus trossulus]|uniref:acid-sensing ion channel 5-like n=1 Tax=Mytilus trossulus TaxID=6551 RepID=UPI003005208B
METEVKNQNTDDSFSKKDIWTNFSQTTGFHGLNKITFERNNPRQIIRSICWITVWLICAIFLVYTVVVELENYYSYPTISNTYIQLQEKLPFPAITICNLSPRSNQVPKTDDKTNNLYMTTSALHMYSNDISWDDPFYAKEGYFEATTKEDLITRSKDVWQLVFASVFDNKGLQMKDSFVSVYTDMGLCLRFNANGSQYTTMYGAMFNLHLYVDVMTLFDYFSYSFSSGVKVAVHDHQEEPIMTNEGLVIKPGLEAFIEIRRKDVWHLMTTYYKDTCDCPQGCQHTTYNFSFSTGTYPSEFFAHQISAITGVPEWYIRANYAFIRIYFKDLSITMTEQVAKYENAGDIFANLGGQLGLFLGASILTITELLELIIFLIWSFIHWVQKKRRDDQSKTPVEKFKPTKY